MVEPADHGEAQTRRFNGRAHQIFGQPTARGCKTDDRHLHRSAALGEPFGERGDDRDGAVVAVEQLARVGTGTRRVHDGDDIETAAAAHQAVSHLSVGGHVVVVGQNDGGRGHVQAKKESAASMNPNALGVAK